MYVEGPPDSESVYTPAFTAALVTAGFPSTPEIGVGPEAASVHAVSSAVPPLSLTTVLRSVRFACWSVFVNVHVTVSPAATLMLAWRVPLFTVVFCVASTQLIETAYPAAAASVTVYDPSSTVKVRVFDRVPSLSSSSEKLLNPVPTVVKLKSCAESGTVFLMIVMVPGITLADIWLSRFPVDLPSSAVTRT